MKIVKAKVPPQFPQLKHCNNIYPLLTVFQLSVYSLWLSNSFTTTLFIDSQILVRAVVCSVTEPSKSVCINQLSDQVQH